MKIIVLDHATNTATIYTADTDDISILSDQIGEREQTAFDEIDIVEMWLSHVKGHHLSNCSYMFADDIDVIEETIKTE